MFYSRRRRGEEMKKLQKQITIRITDRQQAAIDDMAAYLGITRNALCRIVIADRIQSMTQERSCGRLVAISHVNNYN